MKRFFLAVSLLAGTIIGAGIFSLPYVFTKLGLGLGFAYLLVFALVYFFVHWRYAQVLQLNEFGHHFLYFAKKYFSPFLARFASFIVLGELIFVMTVYLILASSFVNLAFDGLGINPVLIFWLLGSVLIFARASWLGLAELAGIGGIILITFLIIGLGGGTTVNLSLIEPVNIPALLLPFGLILFALGGRPAIPKVCELYRGLRSKKRFSLKQAIFWGSVLPIFLYLLFVVGVLRLVPDVSPDTVTSLQFLPIQTLLLMVAIGLITLWTSYFIIGSNVFDILRTDVLRSRLVSGVIAVCAPLILYFVGFQNFLEAVSITGGVFLALEAIFVNMMWAKSAPRPKVFLKTVPLYLIFGAGAVYTIVKFLLI